MVDLVQRQLGLRRLARLTGPIAARGDAGNSRANLDGIGLVGEITFIVGVVDDPDAPVMFVETLNLVFDPSDRLGGGEANPSARLAPGALPPVNFDALSGAMSATLELDVDVPAARVDREREAPSGTDAPDPEMQVASVQINGRFRTPLRPVNHGLEVLELSITIGGPDRFLSAGVFPHDLVIDGALTLTWLLAATRPRRQVLVQPVYIAASATQPSTGSAFPTLLARANEVWGKCCIQLVELSPPIFVSNQKRRIVTKEEAAVLKDEVVVTGAVAVIMVERFEPQGVDGGGCTWGGGTAKVRIVTGDDQLPINRNHLAHEFGHVFSLCHPTLGCHDTRADGCRGSVMEGSGFLSDNPIFQCETNCHHATNPLLTTISGQSCPLSGRPEDQLF